MRHEKYIDIALQIAKSNTNFRTKMAAIIVYQNRIVGVGLNNRKTHPLQDRFKKNPMAIWIHAEIAAINNALRTISPDKLKRSIIYIARYHKDEITQGLAKPCNGCWKALLTFELKKVIYTLDNKGYEVITIGETNEAKNSF